MKRAAIAKNIPQTIEAIRKETSDLGIGLIRGRLVGIDLETDSFPRIMWTPGDDDNWREFLLFAQNLGAKAVVMDYETVDIELLRQEGEVYADDSYSDTWQEWRQLVNNVRPYDGEVGRILLLFQYGNLLYEAAIHAPWYADYEQARLMVDSYDEFMDDDSEPF